MYFLTDKPQRVVFRFIYAILTVLFLASFNIETPAKYSISAPLTEEVWVDSVFNSMSNEERLGQLFMIRAHSDLGEDHIREVERQINTYKVGGLCFFQGTPEKQVELINKYQQQSQLPMLISMDAEWGLGMRMKKSTISFPRQLTLGAITDNRAIYKMGEEIARQLKLVGTSINFAPVADVNNNPKNPVINSRSFGEDRYNVATKCYMYTKGMQDNQVMACAKHFPGHGDTDIDSHKDLPVIPHSRERLDSIELYPFRALAQHGIGSFMVAHLNVPELVEAENRPTTLSKKTITQVLKNEMGFEGLVFTDALEMEGVVKYFEPGEVEAEALMAGIDVLLLPINIDASFRVIKQYIADGKLSWDDIFKSTKKVLKAKYRLGLTNFSPLPTEKLKTRINTPEAQSIKRMLHQKSMTLVRNNEQVVPISSTDTTQLITIAIGASGKSTFQKRIDKFDNQAKHFQLSTEVGATKANEIIQNTSPEDLIVISLHDMSYFARWNYGVTQSTRDFIEQLDKKRKIILVLFGTPYSLTYFDNIGNILVAYEENNDTENLAAQALFGDFAIQGRLPVTASPISTFNTGISTKKSFRLGYAEPEDVGLNSDTLEQIEGLVKAAIDRRATPGCVVLVAKDGKIVYEKAFGYHTYSKRHKVHTDDIYDLASITKIAAATPAIMKLVAEEKIDLDAPIIKYLPELKGSNKEDLHLRDIMAHIAGLKSWIPFFKQTTVGRRRRVRPSSEFYKTGPTEAFSIPVTGRLFMKDEFVDEMWQQIIDSPLPNLGQYYYSDLGFYLIARIVERVTSQPLDQYIDKHLYQPLDLEHTAFKAWEKFDLRMVVPSEEDRYFRRQKVHGYVHDMGAAMLGGVSGHAGLFSNATDLAAIFQTYLQRGQYGGKRIFPSEVVNEFITRHPKSTRRGIGFDMLETNPRRKSNIAPEASLNTFGHLGFTGTSAWADPDHNLIYVFLSNRTYPSMYNYKLGKMDTRLKIQRVIYKALKDKKKEDWL